MGYVADSGLVHQKKYGKMVPRCDCSTLRPSLFNWSMIGLQIHVFWCCRMISSQFRALRLSTFTIEQFLFFSPSCVSKKYPYFSNQTTIFRRISIRECLSVSLSVPNLMKTTQAHQLADWHC